MAQTAKPAAERAADDIKGTTENAAEQGKRAADQATEVTREATERAVDAARQGLHVVERTVDAAAEVTAELGRAFVDLMGQQTQQNLETLKALSEAVNWDRVAKAVDWDRVFQIQGEYLRVSLERAGQLTQRYLEVSQAVVTTAASIAEREAKKAA